MWVRACRRDEIPAGRGWPLQVAGERIAVFDTPTGPKAVENCCAHIGNPIDDGPVSGEILTCPWHGWQYDLSTGHHLTVFGRRPGLRTFPARLDGDEVWVDLE